MFPRNLWKCGGEGLLINGYAFRQIDLLSQLSTRSKTRQGILSAQKELLVREGLDIISFALHESDARQESDFFPSRCPTHVSVLHDGCTVMLQAPHMADGGNISGSNGNGCESRR